MRRIAAAVAVAALVTAVGSATRAAGPPDWKQAPYYDGHRDELWLTPGDPRYNKKCAWKGAVIKVNAQADFNTLSCGGTSYVWAAACKPGRQTVAFTFRAYLPGRPSLLEGSLVSLSKNQLTSMELDVNGHAVLHTNHSVHKVKATARASAFKYGWNLFTLRATKGKTGPCNTGRAGFDTGVYAHLHAQFRADVIATGTPNTANIAGAIIPITVTNKGPSVIPNASVSVSAGTSRLVRKKLGDKEVAILITGSGINPEKCGYSTFERMSTSCPLGQLNPGASRSVQALFAYDAPPTGDFSDKFDVSWGGFGDTIDPNLANNGGKQTAYVCRPGPCKKS